MLNASLKCGSETKVGITCWKSVSAEVFLCLILGFYPRKLDPSIQFSCLWFFGLFKDCLLIVIFASRWFGRPSAEFQSLPEGSWCLVPGWYGVLMLSIMDSELTFPSEHLTDHVWVLRPLLRLIHWVQVTLSEHHLLPIPFPLWVWTHR